MRKVQSRSAQGRRNIVVGTLVTGLLLVSHAAFAQGHDAAARAGNTGAARTRRQPRQQPAPAAPGLTFDGDAGLIFMQIKPDKTADFESVMAKLHEALTKTDKPERKQQAAGWKIYKSTEPGPGGNVLYVAVINPTLKGADYTVAKILYEVFPTEVQTIFPTYRDSFAAGLSRDESEPGAGFRCAPATRQNAPAAPAPAAPAAATAAAGSSGPHRGGSGATGAAAARLHLRQNARFAPT